MAHSLSLSLPSRTFALALGLASLTLAPRALAQSSAEKAAAAQVLFDEAIRLMKADQTAAACPKLEESQRLDPGMATQFRLAECYEKVGKIASAWATFIEVADASVVARLPDREAVARKRADVLAPQLARLSISVPPAVAALPGVEVQRDGTTVGQALWGVPFPVDPGEHVVTAKAPGKKLWQGKIAAGGAATVLVVQIEPLEDVPKDTAPHPAPTSRRSAVPAIVLGGLAAVGAGVGIGLFAAHSGQRSDAASLSATIKGEHGSCAPGVANAQCGTLASEASSADTLGNASTAAFVTAGAAAVAMAAYLLWPSAKPGPVSGRTIHFSPALGDGQRGLFVTGSF
jgi:hypothetical protein